MDLYTRIATMNGDFERLLSHATYRPILTDYLHYRLKGIVSRADIDGAIAEVSAKRATTSATLSVLAAKAKIEPSPTSSADAARSAARLRDLEPIWPMIESRKVTQYLDVGCGNGAITSAIGQRLGLSKDATIGVDIATWAGHDHKAETSRDITFRTIGQPYAIDAPTGAIDLVTVFMVFHHIIPDLLPKALAEISRVLSPNGLVIIREHDSPNVMIDSLINIEHALFEIVIERLATPEQFAKNYIGKYKPKRDWIAALSAFGFRLIGEPIANTRGTRPFYCVFERAPMADASTPALASTASALGISTDKARSNTQIKEMIANGRRSNTNPESPKQPSGKPPTKKKASAKPND